MRPGSLSDFWASMLFAFSTSVSPMCDDGLHSTHWDPHIRNVAVDNKLDWCRMKAQLATENARFDPHAVSPAGAMGCAQFMRATWDWLADKYMMMHLDPWNCRDSITMYGRHIRELIDRYRERGATNEESWKLACAAYNAGPARVDNKLKQAAKGVLWAVIKDSMPTETINYVARITGLYKLFRR